MEKTEKTNNNDKRFWEDRRAFSYTIYIPERRSGMDRRFENVGHLDCGKNGRFSEIKEKNRTGCNLSFAH